MSILRNFIIPPQAEPWKTSILITVMYACRNISTSASIPARWPGPTWSASTRKLKVARLLDLDPEMLNQDDMVRYFGGHATLPGAEGIVMKYIGHQFGVYNPDLGDGRGLLRRPGSIPSINAMWKKYLIGPAGSA